MPSCSFVIRYNFVSNEIGSVQSKGRARARDSECYLIVERGSTNERRELENLLREERMMAALSTFDQMPHAELQLKIAQQRVGSAFFLCTITLHALLQSLFLFSGCSDRLWCLLWQCRTSSDIIWRHYAISVIFAW